MDLVTIVGRFPKPGETVMGTDFKQSFGGKGANQAVAAARLGSSVRMIGRVGDDEIGRRYVRHLAQESIIVDHVEPVTHAPTGTATIIVAEGNSTVLVVPGANGKLSPQDLETCRAWIEGSDILLVQLEIPMETVAKALDIAAPKKVITVVNPAPFQDIPEDWWEKITYLTPNEHEAEMLVNSPGFKKEYYDKLIVTHGKDGIFYFRNGEKVHIPAPEVEVVDTTGAGDTFNGAFCSFLDQGYSFHDACYYATHAASLSCTKLGAQGGMPTMDELRQFMNNLKEGA